MTWVFGLTSLVRGSPYSRDSLHIFMWESDNKLTIGELDEEFTALSKKFNHDFVVFYSRPPDPSKFHVLCFDVSTARYWDKVAGFITLETDYPQMWERTYDKFWTLRISQKGKSIPAPLYYGYIPSEYGWNTLSDLKDNRDFQLPKSAKHVEVYEKFCGFPVPAWYRGNTISFDQDLYYVHYDTTHQISKQETKIAS